MSKSPVRCEIEIDARGHRCPVPTLRLRRAVEGAPAGAILKLLSDDPLARIDAPHYASEAGLELLALETEGRLTVVRVRKPEP